jgi:acetate kinase
MSSPDRSSAPADRNGSVRVLSSGSSSVKFALVESKSGNHLLAGVGERLRSPARARLALEVLVHRLAEAIGGLVVGLERLDALVFTGGIGENTAAVRRMVLGRGGFFGLTEDAQANAHHGHDSGRQISVSGPVVALVVPTDEELLITPDTARIVAAHTATPAVV